MKSLSQVLIPVIFATLLIGLSLRAEAKTVHVEWDPIEGAIHYDLVIHLHNKPVIQKRMTGTHWKGDLQSGVYFYQIRGIDTIQRAGDWSAFQALVVTPEAPEAELPKNGDDLDHYNDNIPVKLKWKPVAGVRKFEVVLFQDGKPFQKRIVEGTETIFERMPAAKYTWAIDPVLEAPISAPPSYQGRTWVGRAKETFEYTIRRKSLGAPKLKYPLLETFPADEKQVQLRWKDVDGAQAYELRVAFISKETKGLTPAQKGELLKNARPIHVKDTNHTMQTQGEGYYVWQVRALSNLNEQGVAQAAGPGSATQYKLDKNAVFQGDQGYLAFSMMLAPYDYSIKNPTMDVFGSTKSSAIVFRLSGEYVLHPRWAISAGTDLAMLTINNQKFSRKAFDVFGKYRMKLDQSRYGWYFAPKLGAQYREYNEIYPEQTSNFQSSLTSSPITVLGPAIGFDLRKQFSEKFSLGVKAEYFLPLVLLNGGTSGTSIGGSASQSNISLGIQGLYWIDRNWGAGAGGFLDSRSIGLNTSEGQTEIYMDGVYFFGSIVYRFWK